LFEIIALMISGRADNFANIDFVFLDRDGVLNRSPADAFVTSWEQFELLPGVEEAISRINRSGRKVIVVTNQRGIALGLHSEADLQAMHNRLREHLADHGAWLDAIYYCPHDNGQCNCRKPQTGMFEQAFQDFPGAAADNSVMVGDSLVDMEAAMRIGMRSILLADPATQPRPDAARAAMSATACATSLLDFVQRYLM
jgi:D-glycero-D-manno-heptose 1,7-bisphosphate phosphatase